VKKTIEKKAQTSMKKSIEIIDQILMCKELDAALLSMNQDRQASVLAKFLGQAPEPSTETPPNSSASKPTFIHMAGIPGSGKSTFAKKIFKEQSGKAFVFIAFDSIMESLPEYQEMIDAKEAFKQWELPARALGYKLLKLCLEQQKSILLDHSAAHPSHLELLQALQAEGEYDLEMYFLDATPEKVLPIIAQREHLTGRHTPSQLVYERNSLLQEMIPEYQSAVDSFHQTSW